MRKLHLSLLAASAALLPQAANASLMYDNTVFLSAQGFGAAPRALTIQDNTSTVSGCVGVVGNTPTVGACQGADATVDGNKVIPVTGDEVNPKTIDGKKHDAPTASSLAITTASQIGVLYNATDPGSASGTNVTDITLKFFKVTDGTFLGSIDGQYDFANTQLGNGSAGYVFRVSDDEQSFVNAFLGTAGGARLTLEATIAGVHGGPESFSIVKLNSTAVPEPATWGMMLVGFGAAGASLRRRKRTVLQAA